MGSIKPANPFDAPKDAEVLHKAMKGLGTNEQAIIDVLSRRSNSQRQEIKNMFKQMYGKDLVSDLKSELGGHFEEVVVALMLPAAEYDARELKRSVRGLGTDEDALIEIMCSRTNSEILTIKEMYKKLFKDDMEKDIVGDTSGYLKRLMRSICTGHRPENMPLDKSKAREDAMKLYNAGEGKLGTDESGFIEVLGSRSLEQITLVASEYNELSKKSLEQAIKSEFSGEIENGLLAIVKVAKNKPAFFAEKLYKSMKGAGTDDKALIRLVVTRCEVDMIKIKQEFLRAYGKSLENFIKDDTTGDYKKMLLALAG